MPTCEFPKKFRRECVSISYILRVFVAMHLNMILFKAAFLEDFVSIYDNEFIYFIVYSTKILEKNSFK